MTNTTKVGLFILSLCLLFLFVGFHFGGRSGLFIAFLLNVLFLLLLFFFGESKILKQLRAQHIKGRDAWNLNSLVESISIRLGLPPPEIYVFEHQTASAFSLAPSWKRGSICVTSGLLKKLTVAEREAVIVHQICHIFASQTFLAGFANLIINTLVGFAQALDNLGPWKKARPFITLFGPVCWGIRKLAVSAKDFYETDELAASFLHSKDVLAEVLWKLEAHSQTGPLNVPPGTHHLFIVEPKGFQIVAGLRKTHPSIESRIRRLIGYFPI